MGFPTDEDRERVRLLGIVAQSKDGLKHLSLDELVTLQRLVECKNYSEKKAVKSKKALLKKINVRIYELTEGKGIWDV